MKIFDRYYYIDSEEISTFFAFIIICYVGTYWLAFWQIIAIFVAFGILKGVFKSLTAKFIKSVREKI